MRLLLVDDDAGLRELVRTTFQLVDVELREADSVPAAERALAEMTPDVVVLDLGMPRSGGRELFRRLRRDRATRSIPVVLLSGDPEAARVAADLNVDAFLPKPFSPLQLLAVAERLAGHQVQIPLSGPVPASEDAQLMLYARDLRQLLELERGRRDLDRSAYRELVSALACALETRTAGGHDHPERVRRFAVELARIVQPELVADPSLEYGFLLHDVGLVAIPDRILRAPRPLRPDELRVLETHPVLGAQLLAGVSLVRGGGLAVIRSHHERWDGTGYPDGLRGSAIPIAARVFAVADALDAMTRGRPYQPPLAWQDAVREIGEQADRQFDPTVVAALGEAGPRLQALVRASSLGARSA